MKRLALAGLLAWLACTFAWAGGVSVTDDAGRVIVLPHPARRIVSLAPNLTELLFAAGAGRRVVGVVRYSDYPPPARRLPRVGDYHSLDLEAIAALRPDLIVAWRSGNPPAQVARLEALGFPVYFSEPRRLSDIPATLERLGRLAGSEQTARRAAAAFRGKIGQLAATYAKRAPVRVFFEIWNQPLMTVNGRHIISAVLRLCGARNIFGDLSALAPTVGMEAVLAGNPDAILMTGRRRRRAQWMRFWRRWPQLTAVKENHLFFITADDIVRPGPRLAAGAAQVCRAVDAARRGRAAENAGK
ncbi:MAG TPA: cobalamin-binding protein [Betaproteobacteria bacterium]|nr:cobalamin-binding protein [Betaproteobacteria bacterium]